VALVLDRTTRTLYVNGTATGSPATTAESTGSAIGGVTTDDVTMAFLGDIDELTLHRRALSTDEIAAIQTAGNAGICYGSNGAPAFVIEPQPQTVPLFGDTIFFGLAMGFPRPTYQWFFRDAPLVGETNLTLQLTNLTPANDGIYKLVALSGTQSVTSTGATLLVQYCAPTPDSLVAWWPGDGNGLDVTGNHSGKVWSGVTFPGGVAGQAFGFDGTSGYVAVPDAPALSPHVGTNGEMSVEAWVWISQYPERDSITGWDYRDVLTKGEPGSWEYLLRIDTAGVPGFHVVSPSAAPPTASAVGGQLLLNRWHHLVGTLKKGQFVRLYQDGQLVADGTNFDIITADTTSPLYIGRRAEGGFFRGLVDEPAIYSRALNSEEIVALYAGGSEGKCYDGGPKPVFVQEPRDENAYLFNSVALGGMGLGTPRRAYQWYHGGKPIDGATNSALTLSNLSAANAGQYVLVASNQFGATQSRTAILTITDYATVTEGFELGWNGWSTDDYSIWEVGRPTSGPGAAHSGTNCVATVLGGNYPDNRKARLVSSAFLVPTAEQLPRLRFWHWWSFNLYDAGQVQISTDGGLSWKALSGWYGHSSQYGGASGSDIFTSGGKWKREQFDLAPYAGKTVLLGFYFQSAGNGQMDSGWYVDDLMIQVGSISLATVADQTVDEKTPVSFKVNAVGANANSSLAFSLPVAPKGAWIDPESGVFSWTPSERQGPGVYNIPVFLVDYGNGEANEMTTVKVTVNEVNERPWLLPDVLAVQPGQTLHFPLFAGDRDYPRNPLQYSMTGAPSGATLTADTGILDWTVPADAQLGMYQINVTLSDNGSPNYTTNNTITLTVTTNANYGLEMRQVADQDFEFTIQDTVTTEDYILQRAAELMAQPSWQFNGELVPAWYSFVNVTEAIEWLSWDEFGQQRLQRTQWQDVMRVSPTQMPYSFVHKVTDIAGEPVGLFRLVRVRR